jgi:hypothetical protein
VLRVAAVQRAADDADVAFMVYTGVNDLAFIALLGADDRDGRHTEHSGSRKDGAKEIGMHGLLLHSGSAECGNGQCRERVRYGAAARRPGSKTRD